MLPNINLELHVTMPYSCTEITHNMNCLSLQGLLIAGANFLPEPDADDYVSITSKVGFMWSRLALNVQLARSS